ncbi:uracil-DNA glycosylase family protein [Cyanobium gracile UHCC 0139]|uniref:Uracil-DNA glycosylase family protein n=1 Tax=Cyanobium gracile UHCC 0139 TaxID=3110308 RepID=A0ABU5RTT3_9CYAN|nr:uracil-DNA glycosylase family protein [Cyanobium gracile]MEA5391187.1 uracil-DNA glycosylase family protein [Cyanobium gracile UHCC 0139]
MNSKQRQYAALVAKRKECHLCDGLENPALPHLCEFDSDHIGPWSQFHGDLDAQLMVVGQDWGDVAYFNKYRGLDDLGNPTMRNLETILACTGLKVRVTSYADGDRSLFLTNAILCLKRGGLQATIDPQWVTNCESHFLRQQIELVRPRVVVGLGAFAFKAVLRVFGKPLIELRHAIEDTNGCEILDGVRLFAAYHCGAKTVNMNRNLDQQCKDWERIRQFIIQPSPQGRTQR